MSKLPGIEKPGNQTGSPGRKVGRPSRRVIGAIVLALMLLIFAGIVWQASSTSAEGARYPAPGKIIEVSGVGSGEEATKAHKMHLYCTGQGSPTVLLEAGLPEWSIHWRPVQESIARFTRVCAYDRAGYGWSEPGPEPRSARQIAGELHKLLANAGEAGPYVLAAHSFWGPAALLYQHDYPGEVSGMVLVESWGPKMFSPTPPGIQQSLSLTDAFGGLAPFGLLRLGDRLGLLPIGAILRTDRLPAGLRPAAVSAAFQAKMWNTVGDEYRAMSASAEELKVLGNLGHLPLVVIQAGQHEPGFYILEGAWSQAQQELAGLSTQSRLVVAENSGHNVQLEQPDVVVKAIQEVVNEVK